MTRKQTVKEIHTLTGQRILALLRDDTKPIRGSSLGVIVNYLKLNADALTTAEEQEEDRRERSNASIKKLFPNGMPIFGPEPKANEAARRAAGYQEGDPLPYVNDGPPGSDGPWTRNPALLASPEFSKDRPEELTAAPAALSVPFLVDGDDQAEDDEDDF